MAGLCAELSRALGLLPSMPTVMTSAYENKRSGILAQRVMLCAEEPPCLAIAVPKGHRIATLVRDSHSFCINLIDPKQRMLVKKFENGCEPDAFELLEHRTVATGAPCLARALACLDCDVMRHFDLEADHEMYIGQVMGAWIPSKSASLCSGAHASHPVPAIVPISAAVAAHAAANGSANGTFTGIAPGIGAA